MTQFSSFSCCAALMLTLAAPALAQNNGLTTQRQGLVMVEAGNIRLDYRGVHNFTLSNDIAYIEPKARVY